MLINIILICVLILLLFTAISAITHIFFLVPYVPTKTRVVEKMVGAACLKPHEIVYDLGCGDGRLLFAAERKARVKTVGFEIAPLMYFLALARKLLARSKSKICFRNFFKANLCKANVIFCYLFPNVMAPLAEKIKRECKRGTRIVSNTFHIPGLKPHRILAKDSVKGLPTIYVYKI